MTTHPRTAVRGVRQRGAALLLAMIIVTLIATLSVSMVWQQWRAVQVESAERSRAQSAWILSGALDWASLILREDARPSSAQVDHLGEPWAIPLAEARLSTFLAVDKENTEDGPAAFLSGVITDAQSRFNLRNLIGQKGQVSEPDLAILRRLCENVNVSAGIADLVAQGMRNAAAAPGGTGAPANQPIMPRKISQLRWLGVDEQALQRLEPHIVLLPDRTTINVNTAAREVIAAAVPGLNVADAQRLVQYRERMPFRKAQDVVAQLSGVKEQDLQSIGMASRYFEVRGRLRLAERVLEQRSLVERNARVVTVLGTERISSNDGDRP